MGLFVKPKISIETSISLVENIEKLCARKLRISDEVKQLFSGLGIDLKGKKVLDIGSGLGYNSRVMRDLGADVIGVEPSLHDLNISISKGNLPQSKTFNDIVQNLPETLNDSFDVSTLFLYNIPYAQNEEVFKAIWRLTKKNGQVIIGMHDDFYINDPYGATIEPIARRYFSNVKSPPVNNHAYNKKILILSGFKH